MQWSIEIYNNTHGNKVFQVKQKLYICNKFESEY